MLRIAPMDIFISISMFMAGLAPGLIIAYYYKKNNMDSKLLSGFLIYLLSTDQRVTVLSLRSTVAPNLYLAMKGGWQYIIRVDPNHILRNQYGGRVAFAVGNAVMGSNNFHVVTGATIDPSLAIDYDLMERFKGAAGDGRIEEGDKLVEIIRNARNGVRDVKLMDPAYGASVYYTIDLRRLAARLLRDASETTSSMSQSFAYVNTTSKSLSAAVKNLASAEALHGSNRVRLVYAGGIIVIILIVILYVFFIK